MNNQLQIPYSKNNKNWYFLSIFYARENWNALIKEIDCFYQERKSHFDNYLISLSKEQGEHLRITFLTSVNDNNNYLKEIQTYFQAFLEQNPSVSKVSFPYGKAIWANYPNNSLTWNKFYMIDYSYDYISFHKMTIDLASKLLDVNYSEDNIFTVGTYLFVKLLNFIDNKKHIEVLSDSFKELSIKHPSYINAVKEQMNKLDVNQVRKTIDSYKYYSGDENQTELENWLTLIKKSHNIYDYKLLLSFICKIIGLPLVRQMIIFGLLIACNNCENGIRNE